MGKGDVCLTIAIPISLRLLNLTGTTKLLHKSTIWAQIQYACLSAALKDIPTCQSTVIVISGDTVPAPRKDDYETHPKGPARKSGFRHCTRPPANCRLIISVLCLFSADG